MSPSGFDAPAVRSAPTSLWVTIAVGVVSVLLWNLPGFGWVLYPFKLFVTFLHEASHGLAAILTGGQLARFYLEADTSGLALTRGGFRPFILVAGYVGSCVWGGMLLVASRREGWAKPVLLALGVFLIAFTVLFVRNFFGFGVGLGLGAFFTWAAWHGRNWQLSLLLGFLAVQNCFYALSDLGTVIMLAGRPVTTDAALMSRELTMGLVPPVVFAVGIALLALLSFAFFLYLTVRPAGGRKSEL